MHQFATGGAGLGVGCSIGPVHQAWRWKRPAVSPGAAGRTRRRSRKDTTLQKIRRSTIDDLAVAGHELSEEHLTLASGGILKPTATGFTGCLGRDETPPDVDVLI
jgi:hypothetical protein